MSTNAFKLPRMFHPTLHVPDLAEAERWYALIFGCDSVPLARLMRDAPPTPGYPMDYSTFTIVRDLFLDTVDPKRFILAGVQRYPQVEAPRLHALGWYVDGMPELHRALRRNGFRSIGLWDDEATGDEPPKAPDGKKLMIFTAPEDVGLRYQFYADGPFAIDPRTTPGWKLPPVDSKDPLGLEFCSHHTILTSRPERALKLVVDVLGGRIIHEGRNALIGASSVCVALADGVLEYAVPDAGTIAKSALAERGGLDAYFGITWKVADLDRAELLLVSKGVKVRARNGTAIVTKPETSFGIAWGFTSTLQPGDSRRA